MSHDLHQMMLAEPVKRLQIVTAEFAVDLGNSLRWRKPIVLRLGPVLDIEGRPISGLKWPRGWVDV
jgi:hypothetical protein